jgi:integral membrane protein (TIGR01906 family)
VSQATGLPPEEIFANYNALIDYNAIFFTGSLELPTLPMSESGRIHFEEVKRIFVLFQLLLAGSAVGLFFTARSMLRRGRTRFMAVGGVIAFLLLAVVLVPFAIDWDYFFRSFHELFFNNDYWIFDERVDPVIRILPDSFFFACVLMIVALVAGLAILSIVIGRRLRGRVAAKRAETGVVSSPDAGNDV